MRTRIMALGFGLGLMSVMSYAAPRPAGVTPVAAYGQLQVSGGQLRDSLGNPVQLKGMSTMGLQWYGDVVNRDSFTALARDWNVDVIRLALYVGEGGYATRPELKDLVIRGVDLAVELGLYAIIDWHVLTPGNPNDPVYAGAEVFFREMSARYGKTPNVIYEIMNEPNGPVTWARDLKPYATRMVATIRANDPDNIILIGSGTWSQDIDLASADPVAGQNLMYTLHFYAGTHGSSLRDRIKTARSRGAAIFVSEWGTSLSSGTGGPFVHATQTWLDFLDEQMVSWVNWSLCNKNETSAALKALLQTYVEGKGNVLTQEETPLVPNRKAPDGTPMWDVDQLTVGGAYVRARIKGIPVPTYETVLASWDFEGGLSRWAVADDSGAKPALSVLPAESKALGFQADWTSAAGSDAWASAPRLKIADVGLAVETAKTLTFDLYLEAGKTMAKDLEIVPVLQYPPSWWKQLTAVRLTYARGTPVSGGLLKYSARVPLSVDAGARLGHFLLVVVGAGTRYQGKVLVDNVALAASTNGDASVAAPTPATAAALPADNPGTFQGLPWSFEDGTRQGWTVTDDSPARVNLTVGTAQTKALTFSYGWTLPGPQDPWNAAPRVSSSFVNLAASRYKTLSLDVYLRASSAAKATGGTIQVQPVIQSPEHGYWFQLEPVDLVFAKGAPAGDGLLKYTITSPLVSNTGALMSPNAVIRNVILIAIGLETDYEGTVQYDNITLN